MPTVSLQQVAASSLENNWNNLTRGEGQRPPWAAGSSQGVLPPPRHRVSAVTSLQGSPWLLQSQIQSHGPAVELTTTGVRELSVIDLSGRRRGSARKQD